MANNTYYSPFFPAADERGAKGTTIAAVPSAVVSDIRDQVDAIREEIDNGTIGAADDVPPAIPTNLILNSVLTDSGASVVATWTAPADDDLAGYDISVKENDGSFIDFVTTSARYEFKSLRRGVSVTAKVRAFDKAGNRSGYTNEVSVTTAKDTVPPAKPTGLSAEVAFNTINFIWTSPADADLQFVKVRIFNGATGAHFGTRDVNVVPGAQGNTVFTNLPKGTAFNLTVEAYDTSGNSSGQTAAFGVTTAGGIDLNDLTPGLQPIKTVPSLPNASGYTGPTIVFNQADGKLYRYVNGAWKSTGDDVDTSQFVTNENLVNYKIGDSNLNAGVIKAVNLVDGAVTLDKIGSDIVLGTTNLVRNSNGLGSTWTFASSSGPCSLPTGFSPYNNSSTETALWTVVNSAGWSGGNAILVEFSTNTTTKGVYLADVAGLSNANIMKPNKTYMVSFYARGTGGAVGETIGLSYNIGPQLYVPVSQPALTNTYQRYVFRLVQGANVDPQLFYTIADSISNTASSIMFSDFQIEEGTIVSAYSPALIPGEIGGAYLAYKAVSRDKIADQAIGSNQIESLVAGKISGQIVGVQISDNSISAEKISANAVTSDKISAGAVNADKIAANSISANQLSIATRPFSLFATRFAVGTDGYLTWNSGYVQYTDNNGSYVSSEIGAGSVAPGQAPLYFYYGPGQTNIAYTFDEAVQNNQSVFFVGKWHGTKNGFIASSGVGTLINGDQLITGSLHADRITSGTIVGDKIAAGTILAGNIAADAITSDKIKSNSIRATHLMIGSFEELNPDPLFRDTSYWRNDGKFGGPLSGGSANNDYRGWYNQHGPDIDNTMGGSNYAMLWSGAFGLANGERQHLISLTKTNIVPNTVYQLSARIRNATNQNIYVYLRQIRADGSHINDIVLTSTNTGNIDVLRTQFTSHPDVKKYYFIVFNLADNAFDGNVQVADVQVVKAAVGTTIADGVITTDKLSANAVTADKIAANSIVANKLAVSTRPFSLYGTRFRVDNDGKLRWNDGFVQYTNDNGDYVSSYITAGEVAPHAQGAAWYMYYRPGRGVIDITTTEQIQNDSSVFMVGKWHNDKGSLNMSGGVGTLINGDQIITGSVNADRIVARSIGADRIAAGTLTANEIAANTITANRLVVASRPFSTVGFDFTANTNGTLSWGNGYVQSKDNNDSHAVWGVNGGNIGYVGSPMYFYVVPGNGSLQYQTNEVNVLSDPSYIHVATWFGGSSVTTKGGVATILNGDRIVTGSIQATKIVSNSITSNQIAANTITADNIAAGTITAAQIATGALTARVIATGNPDSVIPDSDFKDAAWWTSNVNDSRYSVQSIGFNTFQRCLKITPNGGIDNSSVYFPVEPGATYKIQTSVYLDGAFNGSFRPYIHMPGSRWFGLKTGAGHDPGSNDTAAFTTAGASWDDITHIVTNDVNVENRQWQFRYTGSFTGSAFFSVRIVRVSDTTLIKDGAITTDKITVGTLNADRLLAGSITADKIQANAISTNQLSLGLQSRVINNLANVSFWGNQSISGQPYWSANNDSANAWSMATAPGGGSEVALRMVANSANGNGGWNFSIPASEGFSPNKAYRYYTWYFAENDGKTNSIYHGTENVQSLNGGDIGNPYFFSFDKNSLQRGKWYLMVGVVQPANTGNFGSGQSGLYDPVTGQRVVAGTDYRWRPNAVEGTFRSFQFYGDIGGVAWFTKPVVEEIVQGQTSSIKALMQELDYGSVVNAGSTLIRPGLIQVSGGTTIESWKNGTDSTEIRGGAIAANTISANKLTIGNRGIGFLGLNFEWNPINNYVYWSDGYIYYQDDSNNPVEQYIASGNTGGVPAHRFIYWNKGDGFLSCDQTAPVGDNKVMIATWWGGANLNVNYGGTIIHGDRITTGTINANRIVAGSILADNIQIGNTGVTLAQAPTRATWAGVSGDGKPADGATVGGTLGSNIYDGSALVSAADVRNNMDGFIRSPGGGVFTTQQQTFTGALKVRLPNGVTNTMIKFTVDIYEYEPGYSCTMSVGGYTYGSNQWINVSATVQGASNVEYPARFGFDSDGYACVWIGENNTSWSYPQVTVRDVIVGYANTARTTWEKNWQISFGNIGSFSASVMDTYPAADWRKVTGSGKPENNATVGAPSGTYVGNKLAQDVSLAIDAINDDNIISPAEKTAIANIRQQVVQTYDALSARALEYINSGNSGYGIIDWRNALQDNRNSLVGYIDNNGILNNMSVPTSVSADPIRSAYNSFEYHRSGLEQRLQRLAADSAVWSGVTGNGKPADGATVGAPEGTYVGNKLAETVASSIDAITSDNIVSPVEKTVLYNQYRQVHEEEYYLYIMATKFVNEGKGGRYGVEGQRNATRNARNTFISYLDNLGMFANMQAATNVDGNAIRGYYNSYVASANALKEILNNLTAEAANWDLVTGTGKPANNATVGAPTGTYVGNNLAETVESWAYTGQQDPVGRINAGVTTISGGKITTGSISALQIAANSITADRLNVTSLSSITADIGTLSSTNAQGYRVVRTAMGSALYLPNGALKMRWGVW